MRVLVPSWLRGAWLSSVGTAVVLLGVALVAYGVVWQLGWAPGSHVEVPKPFALERAGADSEVALQAPQPTVALASPTLVAPMQAAAARLEPTDEPAARSTSRAVAPAMYLPIVVADTHDRLAAFTQPQPTLAVRLAIPAIDLDTVVEQGGVRPNRQGELEWETLPFVAVHYSEETSKIGIRGNAVIAGHVVTLNEGNVFRNLYQVGLQDEVRVWDDAQQVHRYQVTNVRLVSPSDVWVMAPTVDETLTLITCGGEFRPAKREFSDRLVVTAKPIDK